MTIKLTPEQVQTVSLISKSMMSRCQSPWEQERKLVQMDIAAAATAIVVREVLSGDVLPDLHLKQRTRRLARDQREAVFPLAEDQL